MEAVPAHAEPTLTPNRSRCSATTQAQIDPFYQSTPRTNPSGMNAVVAAMQQVVPPQPPARQSRQPAPRSKVPACPHMQMSRIYGEYHCHNCGRIPAIGWLYACQQDNMPAKHDLSVSESVDCLPTVADDGSYFEAQAQVAASIGMSASVIKQMRSGAYTYDQIETLLAQRRHVINTIREAKHPSSASVPPTPKSPTRSKETPDSIIASVGTTASTVAQKLNIPGLPMTPAGTPNNTPADSQATTPSGTTPVSDPNDPSTQELMQKEVCAYLVCHTCRPFFRERVPNRLDPVLKNEVSVLADQDMTRLPVHDAAVVSNLGLRRPLPGVLRRSKESMDITMHQQDGNGYESFGTSDWTPTTTSSSEGDSDIYGTFDLSPCPGPSTCPVWIPNEGCAYDQGFDDGKREITHGYNREELRLARGLGISGTDVPVRHLPASLTSMPDRSTPSKGSSVSLPNPPTTPLTTGTISSTYSYSLPDRSSPASNKSSHSSRGSEVEVDGGVALTEEAVESGTPDLGVQKVEAR